jgi:hypothetical protein
MRYGWLLGFGFCLSLLPTTYAAAGAPLTTPPLLGEAGSSVNCFVANVGTTRLNVTIEYVQLGDGGMCSPTLDPGEVGGCAGTIVFPSFYYCRFTGGTKKQLRAAIVITDSSGMTVATLPAQ